MDLESSHEPGMQESSHLARAVAIDHSTDDQEHSLQEYYSASVAPVAVTSDPDKLEDLLHAWVSTQDWPTSQAYLQTHAELLTELAEQVIETLISLQTDQQTREVLEFHQQLLQTARLQGVEGAYENLLQQNDEAESASNDHEELEGQVISWLQTPDWDTSQKYLLAHPYLLSERAEQILEQLKQDQAEEDVRSSINYHQTLLHQARTWEIAGVYNYARLAEQAKSIEDNELEVLSTQLEEWLITLDWEQERAYLEAHPNLLTNAAEFLLATGWLIQKMHQEQINIARHLQLLRNVRASSITSAYARLPEADVLNEAAIEALHKYSLNERVKDFERWLECLQQALFLTLPNSPDRPRYLNNLGIGLHDRYKRTGETGDLDWSISLHQQAVEATPDGSPDQPHYLNNLGIGLYDHYEHTGVLDDLERAIFVFQQTMKVTPIDSPDRPQYLSNLGVGLHNRYARTGTWDDLEQSIAFHQQAMEATPAKSSECPRYLNNLGIGLRVRYGHTGALSDLEQAISLHHQAVETTPDSHLYLNNLGIALHTRYRQTGVLDDLERAIVIYQQVVKATPSNSPSWCTYLNGLGDGLYDRYERAGELDDLEQSIAFHQQVLEATPSNSPDRLHYLSYLGDRLLSRYERTGELGDLERAIDFHQQAVEATPANSSQWPMYLNSLGNGLQNRYERIGELGDLEQAIFIYQQAVKATPADSPSQPMHLINLGIGLSRRYGRMGELDDLQRAIALHQQVIAMTSSTSPNLSTYLNNLGAVLRDRYEHTGVLDDLQQAIAIYQQLVEATSSTSPDRYQYLSNLGRGLHARYEHTKELVDLEKVITTWEANWSFLHLRFVSLPIAYQLGRQRQGVHIAAFLVTAYLERAERQRATARIDLYQAFEVAEGSKSRLLTQLVGRGSLPLPPGLSPEIAAREQYLLADLTTLDTLELTSYNPPGTTREETGSLKRLQQRQADLQELEDLWDSIGCLGSDGTEYVTLRRGTVPRWQELAHIAREAGPATALLSFFMTPDHALLFILRAGWRRPRVSKISFNDASWDNLLQRFFREVHLHTPGLRRGETWDLALQPLLTRAHHHLAGVERLILAPEGNAHLLPWSILMERAGWRTPAGQPLPLTTLPALDVLPRLRRRSHAHFSQTLVVGNPTGDLPYAEDEAREVAACFGSVPLLGSAATKDAVLAQFAEASLIHLATHAFFDLNAPLESGIVLADGVLTAREVLQHRLHADLLVLSACESGQIGSLGGEELAGLSQAFLQAGVRSLLVSLWEVNDLATAALMQAFYTARQAGADKALALRQAMTQIQQHPRWTHPYYWGAFVFQGDWD